MGIERFGGSHRSPRQSDEKRDRNRFIGSSCAFESINGTIRMVAPRNSSVIINGETGTGKEMVARQIHMQSQRSGKPFIPVDCTSLNGSILESQLFGHVKGAFTGAVSDTVGFFRAADGGTLFLDEIGELELDFQAKLLRVLQESAVTAVGATKAEPVDVRVLCATHRDLKAMIKEGTFRSDLYFRLNIIRIEIPPLRERGDDSILLAEHFLEKQAALYGEKVKRLSDEAAKTIRGYGWPGNVRELANVMEHAHIVSKGGVIEVDDLPEDVLSGEITRAMEHDGISSFKELQKRLVRKALAKANGKKMATARLLEIDHRQLDRLVDEFGLEAGWR